MECIAISGAHSWFVFHKWHSESALLISSRRSGYQRLPNPLLTGSILDGHAHLRQLDDLVENMLHNKDLHNGNARGR
jgi:hypothetical protein